MNLSLSEATEIVKAKTPGLQLFIPKLFCYHIHEKSMKIFTETTRLFVCFLPVFSSFRILVLYFSSFNFSIFVSLAFKINNYTDLKLVRKQHWNFNEFNFYIC
jgi:hypothetical protein